MFRKTGLALLLAVAIIATANAADYTAQTGVSDSDGGHMETDGFRNSTYIDVQSRYSGYPYWGIVRWDLSGVKAEFDTEFGVGMWQVKDVILQMYGTPYTHSNDGNVQIRFTYDDTTSFSSLNNATDGAGSDPIGGQLTADPNNTSGTYAATIFYDNPDSYEQMQYDIYDANSVEPGMLMIGQDIREDDDNKLTLCFVDDPTDYSVSAAWAGPGMYSNYSYERPVLIITATEADNYIPVCTNRPSMDLNDDCVVDLLDFAMFASEWTNCGFANPEDCPQ